MPRAPFALTCLTLLMACGGTESTTDPGPDPDPDPVASRVTLSETGLDFTALGQSTQVTATVLDQDDQPMTATVTWSVDDGAVATVAGGLVTAVANGSTTLTAAVGVVSSTISVDVDQEADTIVLSTTDVQFTAVGQTEQIDPTVLDSGGSTIPGAVVTWTEDDAAVATVSAGGLVTAEGAGGTTVTATSDGATSDAAVTVTLTGPSEIVFSSFRDGNWEVYVMNSDGSNPVNLTNAATDEWSGMAEPGGGRVVLFVSDRDGDPEIYAMDRDAPGAAPENLTNDAREDRDPAWSWDGSQIAFSRNDSIWIMNPDGSNQTPLDVWGRHPSWSPDGTQIAYVTGPFGSEAGETAIGDLRVMNADGSNGVRASPTSLWNDMTPEWSPDGTRILFATRFTNGGRTVYSVDPDGTDLMSLNLSSPSGERWGSWSPDGTRVALAVNDAGDFEIWTKSSTGGSEIPLTDVAGDDIMPKWIR